MLRNYVKVIEEAREKNKTIILPDENVIPSNIGVNTNRIKHVDLKKIGNVIKYKRVCAMSDSAKVLELCNKKYKFIFVAPNRTTDKGSYYEMDYKNAIPKGFIRLVFCLRPSDSLADCKHFGVSRETWEASKSKYITILPFRIKEDEEETQQSIMEEIADYIVKRMYKHAKITIININENEENDEQ